MCVAILVPKGVALNHEHLRNSWEYSPDGGGYAFAINGRLIIRKPFFKFKHLKKALYQDLKKYGHASPFIVHCRLSTSGNLDKTCTHPHRVNEDITFIHNGILNSCLDGFCPGGTEIKWVRDTDSDSKWMYKQVKVEKKGPSISDTVYFCEQYLQKMPDGFLHSEGIMKMMEGFIGSSNKLVFLDSSGYYRIVNEEAGSWSGGVWFSNTMYRDVDMYKSGYGIHYTKKTTLDTPLDPAYGFDDFSDETEEYKLFHQLEDDDDTDGTGVHCPICNDELKFDDECIAVSDQLTHYDCALAMGVEQDGGEYIPSLAWNDLHAYNKAAAEAKEQQYYKRGV